MRVLVSFLNGWPAESLAKLIKPDKKLATDPSFSSIFNNSSEHELANVTRASRCHDRSKQYEIKYPRS